MQLKFILRRADGTRAQVAATADATASVGDLASALANADPERRTPVHGGVTLKLEHTAFDSGTPGRLLDPARSLIDSGMRSGSTVSLVAGGTTVPRSRRGRSVAVLRVLDGPDLGREFSLPPGNSIIGRGRRCDVQLNDPAIAEVHATLRIDESIEISNLATTQGVSIGGQPVQRASVGSTDVVQLGGTSVAILHTVRPGTTQTDSVAIEFNRSPRVLARFDQRKFSAPKPPQPLEPTRFPIISMVLPLLMGLVLLAVTRNLLSVVFVGLSPLLMIGMYLDAKYQAKKKHDKDVQRFAEGLRQLAADLTSAQQVERAVRRSETPALAEVVESIHRLGPLLWTHRPEHPEFLTARIGLGEAPSRCRVELSGNTDGEQQYLQQVVDLAEQFDQIADVPVVVDLVESGALGICGPRGVADGVARGIVMQLIGLHSPAELTIVAFSSAQARVSWEWLEWLPHVGSVYSPLSGNHLTDSPNGGIALLSRLEALVKERVAGQRSESGPTFGAIPADEATESRGPLMLPAVIVVVDDTAPIDRSRLTRLAEQGAAVGVHVMWLATQISGLPAACRTYVLVENDTTGSTVGQVRHGRHTFPVACDAIDVADARQIALLLAPVVDVGAAVDDSTDLPRSVSYLSLSGAALASDPNAVARLWTANESITSRPDIPRKASGKPATLRALVGSTGVQDFYLDLREHGPHALVGGTTGSGKSEFLQSWILGMATAHSPDRLTFLLVDYKGGTAFAECAQLPHTVGLVTDLSPHLVRRALTSLGAEIKRREELLNLKRAKDLVSLEATGDPETPPALVIIVDEFAALASEVPEFVDGVIDVAQRGRSLGLHLILATQRPAGVIKDNLRANTNLRIALRLNDIDDSLDVIDDPMAAYFPPEIPGRAVAKTGPGRLTNFQSGYVGGWSDEQPDSAPIDLWEFVFGRRRPWLAPAPSGAAAARGGPTDIARMVATVRATAAALKLPEPRKPWLPPMQPIFPLESIAAIPNRLALGRVDIPASQQQPIAAYAPDQGNLAIIGTSGSGKSTALRTLAIASALASDGPSHVYALDFAAGSLQMLEPLPHVAAVITAEDDERIGRVLRRLTALLDERSRKFARANVSDLTGYRQEVDAAEPRILLLVDGIGAFRETYEHVGHSTNYAMFSQLTADGRRLGLHVIVTADRPGALSTGLASMMQSRLTLRLASEDDYLMMGVPKDILSVNSPPGRGVMGGNEIQVAVYGGDDNVAVQARAIGALAGQLREQGFVAPEPIARLEDHIELGVLPALAESGLPAVGLAAETLAPIGIRPQGIFMLTGPPGSGRTTTLLTLAQAVRRANAQARIVHLSPSHSAIAALGAFDETASGASAVLELAERLNGSLSFGPAANLTVLIESVADFTGTDAENEVAQLVKVLADASAFVVGEAEVSAWSQAWTLAQPFKSARRGLLLAPGGVESDTLLNTPIGTIRRNDFPPGRGVLIEKGKGVWIQVAQPDF